MITGWLCVVVGYTEIEINKQIERFADVLCTSTSKSFGLVDNK